MLILSGNELLAIKFVAVATPVAGLAAFARVRARRRRARAERARSTARKAIIEIRAAGTTVSGRVAIELTPHLLACLAAADSAHLRGYPTPDSVMMAPAVEATWETLGERDRDEFQAASKLIVTREFVKVRSSSRSIESIRVPLRELLEAHRRTPSALPLYCEAGGTISPTPFETSRRALRVGETSARKEFYWVRAHAAAKAAKAESPTNREI
ncbi:hypothetical protein [Variovorax sp. YR216]|uniref:hypothetical protein n=1 Tax=Variovorax sp. YR216 TaxID=1882828 RepID=UPI0008981ACD|nr:hypothetical protein [Variovorax sp. YR216]SEB15423.1 hypothetical protein SAMN05444680_1107 [Variovorax sp. YR216]